MEVIEAPVPGVLVIRPRVFRDDRGHFMEGWRRARYEAAGVPGEFVQDNVAFSKKGVLRGLHYQWPDPQGKLVMAVQGEVFDVAVDIRRGSPTFAQWYGHVLTAEEGTQLWIPEGFAHGYVVRSEIAVVLYKCTRPYDPGADRAILWNDPEIGVEWGIGAPLLSEKDRAALELKELSGAELPRQ